jgi:hypothetical protein
MHSGEFGLSEIQLTAFAGGIYLGVAQNCGIRQMREACFFTVVGANT